jgi:PKHD-type hydroxylase
MDKTNLKKNKYLLNPTCYQGAFTPEECRKIINIKDTSDVKPIYSGHSEEEPSMRDVLARYIIRTDETLWLWERIFQYVWQANQEYYNFDISFITDLHLMEYEEDSFFQWHIDLGDSEHFSTRKISIIVFLSERTDYEGGQLLLSWFEDEKSPLVEMKQGSIVMFPSFQLHRVKKITGGKRYTLVAWAHGDSFR